MALATALIVALGMAPRTAACRCGGEASLGLDGGEVLHLVPGAAAQVLPPPVQQPWEQQRVQRGAAVVIPGRVDRHPRTGDDLAVGGQGQGEKHRRLKHPAGPLVGERLPRRPLIHGDRGQVGDPGKSSRRAHPTAGTLITVLVGLVVVEVLALIVLGLGLRVDVVDIAQVHRCLVGVGAVPALATLMHPQPSRFGSARPTDGFAGGAAGDRHRHRLAHSSVGHSADVRANADPRRLRCQDGHIGPDVERCQQCSAAHAASPPSSDMPWGRSAP